MSILFHSLYHGKSIGQKREIKEWLHKIISEHKKEIAVINIIFVDDEKMLELNLKYLAHNYYTDIITFNFNEGNKISGDIYISIQRVEENAHKFRCSNKEELLRVLVHGIFHLIGFDDKTKNQKNLMQKLEDEALSKFPYL